MLGTGTVTVYTVFATLSTTYITGVVEEEEAGTSHRIADAAPHTKYVVGKGGDREETDTGHPVLASTTASQPKVPALPIR